jgi:dTDP-4-dehydrorhamnose 3,5-epimerase
MVITETNLEGCFIIEPAVFNNERGLHFQKDNLVRTKLVRVVKGRVLDLIVDIRTLIETIVEHVSIILLEKTQLFAPIRFAHVYSVFESNTLFFYKFYDYYFPNAESGIIINAESLNMDWMLNKEYVSLSLKDNKLIDLKEIQ